MAAPQHPIHFIYRLVFNYLEPLMALAGVAQVHLTPEAYMSTVFPSQRFIPSMQPILTQITSGWFILIFHDLVTLRIYNRDARVWKLVIAANLLSDIAFTYSTYQELGAARFINPSLWTANDQLTLIPTFIPLVLKVTLLLGLGIRATVEDVARKNV